MKRLPAGLVLLLVSHAWAGEPNLSGNWRGALGGRLHLVVSLARDADGKYQGMLESVDQGATLPIESVTVGSTTVRFTVPRVGGVYDGKLDHDTLQGTWTQTGVPPQPLGFTRDPVVAPVPSASPKPLLDAPLEVLVLQPPTPFRAGGHTHLVYELQVTNFSRRELSLTGLEVLGDGKPLSRLDAAALSGACYRPGAPEVAGLDRLRVGAGLRAVLYVWVVVEQTPAALEHRLSVRVDDHEWTVRPPRVAVRDVNPVVIGAPLHGGDWQAGNGPSNASGHRRTLIPIGGRAVIAQRFAIDWVRLNADGRSFSGDAKKNESYRAYGAEALAVADGVVTATKDGLPQNLPGATRAVPIALDTVAGNHVIVDLGGGYYAFYAHLQPGSLRVKVGDQVRRGQVVGLVGNSGNSTEPHLHFHIADANSPLGGEGLPYALDAFRARAKKGAPLVERKLEQPLEDEVVDFR